MQGVQYYSVTQDFLRTNITEGFSQLRDTLSHRQKLSKKIQIHQINKGYIQLPIRDKTGKIVLLLHTELSGDSSSQGAIPEFYPAEVKLI